MKCVSLPYKDKLVVRNRRVSRLPQFSHLLFAAVMCRVYGIISYNFNCIVTADSHSISELHAVNPHALQAAEFAIESMASK